MLNAISLPKYVAETDIWDKISNTDKPILVYGMGNGADKLIAKLAECGKEVADFFASDGFVRGHSFHGKRVLSFSEVKEKYDDFIILLSFASGIPEVISTILKTGEEHELYIPDMPVVDEEYFTADFYNKHYNEIKKAYELLSDEKSKELFSAIINYKLSAEAKFLHMSTSSVDEMYSLLDCDAITCAVDAGAYNGDTVKQMLAYFGNLKKIYAIEPDCKNCKKLRTLADTIENCEIKIFESALWNCNDTADFSSSNNRNSSLLNSSHKHKDMQISLIALDGIISERVDYIKYDVEGVEKQALEGSMQTIEKYRPALLVSAYHKSEDVFSLVNMLSSRLSDYLFFLRRKMCYPAWEINLYAIPKEKVKTE